MNKHQSTKRYLKEEILTSSKKYENQRDWLKNEPTIYRCATGYNKKNSSKEDKEFWNNCIKHMEYIFKPNGWWTYERCKEDALKYSTKKEFRDKSHAYDVILKNGWWGELCAHITTSKKPSGYWTYENCKETALKYNDREELSKKEGNCYGAITKNNWHELISHIEKKSSSFNRFIYAFEFSDNHVYVGLTYNLNKRKSDHLTTEKRVSPVVEHIKKTGLDYTFKTVFDESYPKDIAGEMEKIALQDYIEKGWIPLNKAKPGSLGGMKLMWTYEKIKEELKGIKTLSEAKKKIPLHAFENMKKYGWWDEFISPLIIDARVFWTVERALEELKKYETRLDMRKNQNGLYKFLHKNGLLQSFPKQKTSRKNLLKNKFTKEQVYGKCLTYKTGGDVMKYDREYYTCAKNNGWWDDIINILKDKREPKSKYTYDICMCEVLKYKHISDFEKGHSGMVKIIKKNNWWEEMTKHMVPKPRDKYKLEEIIELCKGYTVRSKLQKEKSGVYKYIKRHNLIDKLIPLNNR
jgi:REP element-mobilizing transposase RayT